MGGLHKAVINDGRLKGTKIMSDERIETLVNRFLAWPLPTSVCADTCATAQPGTYPYPRSGTNLLNADEARQMIEHLLVGPSRLLALLDAADEALDKETYDQLRAAQFDPNEDEEFTITVKTWRKVNALINELDRQLKSSSPTP